MIIAVSVKNADLKQSDYTKNLERRILMKIKMICKYSNVFLMKYTHPTEETYCKICNYCYCCNNHSECIKADEDGYRGQ